MNDKLTAHHPMHYMTFLRCVSAADSLVSSALTWVTISSDTMPQENLLGTHKKETCVCVKESIWKVFRSNPSQSSFTVLYLLSSRSLHHFCLHVSSHLLLSPLPSETQLSSLSTNLSLSIYPPFHCLCTCPSYSPRPLPRFF